MNLSAKTTMRVKSRHMGRKVGIVLMAVTALAIITAASPKPAHANPKYGSIVVDAYTGEVLSEDMADKQLYLASLTKIMTLFMVFEALERKEIKLDDQLKVSKRAAGMPPSKLGLPVGSTIKMEDAILALVTKSANDVAVVIGEAIAGSEIQFARKMTDRARQLGMSRTTFRNASGLPNRYQRSTARDMATLARVMISRFPDYYTYFSTRSFAYKGRSYRNHNKLLGHYDGVDGIKTGYINASGFNLVASAQRDGRRIIGVVFGGRTSARRNNHMVKLLDRGFETANSRSLVLAGTPPIPTRRPGANATEVAVAENRVLQVAMTDKPTFLKADTQAVAALPVTIAANQPQPDVMPEDMLNVPAIPSAKPDIAAPAPKLVIAGLGPVSPSVEDFDIEDEHGQGDRELGAIDLEDLPADSLDGDSASIASLLGGWSIQVGAFRSEDRTSVAISNAVSAAPELLSWAEPRVKPLVTGRGTLYRARLAGLDETTARDACRKLERSGIGCLAIQNTASQ